MLSGKSAQITILLTPSGVSQKMEATRDGIEVSF